MNRSRYVALVAVTAVIVLAGGAAIAAIPDSSGTIHGCYQTSGGQLRVIDTGSCDPAGETAISWSQAGPTGPQGPKGDPGPSGPSGGSASVKNWTSTGSLIIPPTDSNPNPGFQSWSIPLQAGYWVYTGSVVIGLPQVRDRVVGPSGTDPELKHHDFAVNVNLRTGTDLAEGDAVQSFGVPFSSLPNEAGHVSTGQSQTVRFSGNGYLKNPGELFLWFYRRYGEKSTFEISDIRVRATRYSDYSAESIQLPTRAVTNATAPGPVAKPPAGGSASVAVKTAQRSALAALASGPQPQTRARIVLLANRGVGVSDIAAATFTSPAFVRRTISGFKRSGLRAVRR